MGLIAPGGVVDEVIVGKCVANLEQMGFKVVLGNQIFARWGGYAGTIEQRLSDLHAMFADGDVRAIWTARGGSGCAGLLPHIDYAKVRRDPKILIGYSDITALHLALYAKARMVSFHGPVAWSTPTAYSVGHMRAALMSGLSRHEMRHAPENLARAVNEPLFQPKTHASGIAAGALVGGNLSVLAALVGTPYAAPLTDRVLFLEEIDEAPYRIDRLLHQLQQSNATGHQGLRDCAGVMLGVFQKCEAKATDKSLRLTEVFAQHLDRHRGPATSGYSLGHISHQMTLPIGIRAELDTERETLTWLDSPTDAA